MDALISHSYSPHHSSIPQQSFIDLSEVYGQQLPYLRPHIKQRESLMKQGVDVIEKTRKSEAETLARIDALFIEVSEQVHKKFETHKRTSDSNSELQGAFSVTNFRFHEYLQAAEQERRHKTINEPVFDDSVALKYLFLRAREIEQNILLSVDLPSVQGRTASSIRCPSPGNIIGEDTHDSASFVNTPRSHHSASEASYSPRSPKTLTHEDLFEFF